MDRQTTLTIPEEKHYADTSVAQPHTHSSAMRLGEVKNAFQLNESPSKLSNLVQQSSTGIQFEQIQIPDVTNFKIGSRQVTHKTPAQRPRSSALHAHNQDLVTHTALAMRN